MFQLPHRPVPGGSRSRFNRSMAQDRVTFLDIQMNELVFRRRIIAPHCTVPYLPVIHYCFVIVYAKHAWPWLPRPSILAGQTEPLFNMLRSNSSLCLQAACTGLTCSISIWCILMSLERSNRWQAPAPLVNFKEIARSLNPTTTSFTAGACLRGPLRCANIHRAERYSPCRSGQVIISPARG